MSRAYKIGHTLRPFESILAIMSFSFDLSVEHTLCITCAVLRVYICTNSTSIENFFKQDWPQIYTNSNYENGVCGFFAEGLNYYCTFQWTYMDIFIISISICLSTRVNQLNAHLKQYKGMVWSFSIFNLVLHIFLFIIQMTFDRNQIICVWWRNGDEQSKRKCRKHFGSSSGSIFHRYSGWSR